ncbi:hypothetical protein pb186bvf_014650 [Paramecium bursaria]
MEMDIEGYKLQIQTLESRLNQYNDLSEILSKANHRNDVLVAEIERLNKVVFEQDQLAEELRNRCGRLDLTLIEYKAFEMNHRDMVSKARNLADEIDRLKEQLYKKHQEYEDLNTLYKNLQQQMDEEIQKNLDLTHEVETLKSGIEKHKMLSKIVLLGTENDRLKGIITKRESSIRELEQLINELNEKYNNQLRDNDELRIMAIKSDKAAQKAISDLQSYQQKIDQLNKRIEQLEHELRSNQTKREQEQQQQIDILNQRIKQLQDQLKESENRNQDLQRSLRDSQNLSQQIERQLKEQIQTVIVQEKPFEKQKEKQVVNVSDDSENKRLKRQISDQLCLIVLFTSEIESLRRRIPS